MIYRGGSYVYDNGERVIPKYEDAQIICPTCGNRNFLDIKVIINVPTEFHVGCEGQITFTAPAYSGSSPARRAMNMAIAIQEQDRTGRYGGIIKYECPKCGIFYPKYDKAGNRIGYQTKPTWY